LENLEFFKVEIEKRNLEVINEIPDKTVKVMADPEELNRIITNLLSNAVKYNNDGGSITISAGKKKGSIFFTITDTGIGMSEEEKERLFEDFFRANNPLTRKQPGTGLGLAITKRMVEANFGRIEAESETGKGSSFTVILPAA
jgi:signal transduction histidine kinase